MSYLSTLHSQPPHHKKRFALLTSATITLFIFGIWSLATFGITDNKVISKNGTTPTTQVAAKKEVSPFESLRLSVATSLTALKDNILQLKSGIDIYGGQR